MDLGRTPRTQTQLLQCVLGLVRTSPPRPAFRPPLHRFHFLQLSLSYQLTSLACPWNPRSQTQVCVVRRSRVFPHAETSSRFGRTPHLDFSQPPAEDRKAGTDSPNVAAHTEYISDRCLVRGNKIRHIWHLWSRGSRGCTTTARIRRWLDSALESKKTSGQFYAGRNYLGRVFEATRRETGTQHQQRLEEAPHWPPMSDEVAGIATGDFSSSSASNRDAPGSLGKIANSTPTKTHGKWIRGFSFNAACCCGGLSNGEQILSFILRIRKL